MVMIQIKCLVKLSIVINVQSLWMLVFPQNYRTTTLIVPLGKGMTGDGPIVFISQDKELSSVLPKPDTKFASKKAEMLNHAALQKSVECGKQAL